LERACHIFNSKGSQIKLRKLTFPNDPFDAETLDRNRIYYDLTLKKKSCKDEQLFAKAKNLFILGSKSLNKVKENCVFYEKNSKIREFPLDIKLKNPTKLNSKVDDFYFNDLNQSWNLLREKKTPRLNQNYASKHLAGDLYQLKQNYHNLAGIYWKFLVKIFGPKNCLISKSLFEADLWPRITPFTLIKYLLAHKMDNLIIPDEYLHVIGAFFVISVNIRQIERMIMFSEKIEEQNLLRECLNIPHSNWSPSKYPGWLIFEIESSLTIREIQVKIAQKLMNAQKNTVLQLNMGEGKSSVIVPMLSIALADGKKLIRLIVLNSLFRINYSALVQKLGGALNKRIYTFKCTREMAFTKEITAKISKMLRLCKTNKGLLITMPEQILSFKLKCVEMSKENEARELLDVQKWINNNVMDILDESDEILNVMFQCNFLYLSLFLVLYIVKKIKLTSLRNNQSQKQILTPDLVSLQDRLSS
jgi:hypothetical protein